MQDREEKEATTSGQGFFARLYWMFIGNAILFFLLVYIVEKRVLFPSLWDAACWLTLASLIVVRYADIRFLNGETNQGEAATMSDWWRYSKWVAVAGGGLWLIARVVEHVMR
jgi:hypothetical protein